MNKMTVGILGGEMVTNIAFILELLENLGSFELPS
jgi:hypothetical protein